MGVRWLVVPLGLGMSILFAPRGAFAQTADSSAAPEAPPPARRIPGINADDPFPNACVSCHINMPDRHMDTRISTLMKQWNESVPPALLEKAQAAAANGVTLTGKHPKVEAALRDIPAGCLKCHAMGSKKAPPLARLTHLVHLTGGDENHFMTLFQGECTHCHKLDRATGAWSIPSAPEP